MFTRENVCIFLPWVLFLSLNRKIFVRLFEINHLVSRGIAIEDHRIWTAKAGSVTECAQMCLRRRPCLSFNFDALTTICELNNGVLSSSTSSKTGHMWIYSEISLWPSQIDPDCYGRPCSEDEVCVPGSLSLGDCCSYKCIKLYGRCPLPDGVVLHGSRSVGTMLNPSCRRGYWLEGDGAANTCQAGHQWNRSVELLCKRIYRSVCHQDDDCEEINGKCHSLTCLCDEGITYDDVIASCKNVSACPSDWVLFGSSCYLLGSEELNYTSARKLCLDLGGSLVQVDTVEERDFLYDKMRTAQPQPEFGYWNDLYEVTVDGQEKWRETNDPLDQTVADWNSGQPMDHGGPQKCTMFYKSFGYKWADLECEEHTNRKARALCEKRIKL